MHGFTAWLNLHCRCIAVCILLAVAWNEPAQAALPPVYDVEIIIFINRHPGDDGERWNKPDADSITPTGAFQEEYFTELAPAFYTLGNISYALDHSGRYSVLFHRAWRQLAYGKANAAGYPIHSFSENGRDSVEGIVRLVRERFLHLDVDLQLMEAVRGSKALYSDAPGNEPAFELVESRRIRSNILHYFDHPRFGMIAKVTPYVPPGTDTADSEINGDSEALQPSGEQPEDETVMPLPNPADDQLTR